jgi:hypothetical protein
MHLNSDYKLIIKALFSLRIGRHGGQLQENLKAHFCVGDVAPPRPVVHLDQEQLLEQYGALAVSDRLFST